MQAWLLGALGLGGGAYYAHSQGMLDGILGAAPVAVRIPEPCAVICRAPCAFRCFAFQALRAAQLRE
jgi:hypothetical protein